MDELDRLKQVLPENVIQLKSVGKYQDADALSEFAPIHIVIGSSEGIKNLFCAFLIILIRSCQPLITGASLLVFQKKKKSH